MMGRAAFRDSLILARLDEQSPSTSSKRRLHVSPVIFYRARDGEPVMMGIGIYDLTEVLKTVMCWV